VSSRLFPHFSLIEERSKLAISGLPVSMSALPSYSELKDLTPTFIAVEFMFDFTTVLIASVVRLLLDFTSSCTNGLGIKFIFSAPR